MQKVDTKINLNNNFKIFYYYCKVRQKYTYIFKFNGFIEEIKINCNQEIQYHM